MDRSATPVNVLFIGGYGRSGSTVIELLLSQVEGVAVLGEVRHLFGRVVDDREHCACGREVTECPRWGLILRTAFPEGHDRDRILAAFREVNRVAAAPAITRSRWRTPTMRRHLATYADAFARIYRAVHELTGAVVVVDSSKYPMHALGLIHGPRQEDMSWRSMLLVRDPRAVAYSWERPKVRPEITHEVRMMPRHNVARSAAAWVVSNALTETVRTTGLADYRVQRYEDFVDRPLLELRAMVEFGGGDPGAVDDAVFDVHEDGVHTIAGNPLDSRSGRITVAPRDEWRTAMPEAKQRLVALLAHHQMRRYGYS
ncbi:hypothetical protein [uncultured Demequina sp.]|uniref:hypothetical protein n=1 Tax=uncultured Demequina sp. TaxID=693499 RepID=UPI0025E98E55|nr:hypothetical protein [uncultured Demequina sp.]